MRRGDSSSLRRFLDDTPDEAPQAARPEAARRLVEVPLLARLHADLAQEESQEQANVCAASRHVRVSTRPRRDAQPAGHARQVIMYSQNLSSSAGPVGQCACEGEAAAPQRQPRVPSCRKRGPRAAAQTALGTASGARLPAPRRRSGRPAPARRHQPPVGLRRGACARPGGSRSADAAHAAARAMLHGQHERLGAARRPGAAPERQQQRRKRVTQVLGDASRRGTNQVGADGAHEQAEQGLAAEAGDGDVGRHCGAGGASSMSGALGAARRMRRPEAWRAHRSSP